MKILKLVIFVLLLFCSCAVLSKKETHYNWSTLDVDGFKHTLSGENILVIKKALIRSDGECNLLRGDGDIGLHIYYLNRITGEWVKYKVLRMFGHNDHGEDELGEQYEWQDNHGIIYENYGIVAWKDFPGEFIRFELLEGDHGLTKDDVVFNRIVKVKTLMQGDLVQIDGDLKKKEATLWVMTEDIFQQSK